LKSRKFNFKVLLEQAQRGELSAKQIKQIIKAANDFGQASIVEGLKVSLILPTGINTDKEAPKELMERAAKGIVYLNELGHSLSRTKQMLHRHGVVETINRNAAKAGPSKNLKILADAGLLEMSSEAIALDYPEYFDPKTVESAAKKLESLHY
jgi:sugar phosphate isomerase/epimerase